MPRLAWLLAVALVPGMQSVSKSVTSLVAGIAADSGAFDVELPVVSILPEYAGASPDPRLDRVTGRHLLEMRSGIDFSTPARSGSTTAEA